MIIQQKSFNLWLPLPVEFVNYGSSVGMWDFLPASEGLKTESNRFFQKISTLSVLFIKCVTQPPERSTCDRSPKLVILSARWQNGSHSIPKYIIDIDLRIYSFRKSVILRLNFRNWRKSSITMILYAVKTGKTPWNLWWRRISIWSIHRSPDLEEFQIPSSPIPSISRETDVLATVENPQTLLRWRLDRFIG